ncbi:MAG: sigma-54-dependent transcriptional regulator [Verrucomicrobiia bacterium]
MRNTTLTGLSILIVEDDPLLHRQIAATLEKLGADVTGAKDLGAARRLAKDLDFEFVLLDLNLPDGFGMDLLREGAFSHNAGVVIMTAFTHVSSAVEAMKLGALDYLVKPFSPVELPLVLERAQRARQLARQVEHRRAETRMGEFFFGASLRDLQGQLDKILAADQRVDGTPSPVLVEGETGTGKTMIARWIHQQGPRARQPLVEVNCSALPESLAESELFGHERGAFTDAKTARMGLFEAANGGTLFLDELPSLPPSLQAKVLTALEDHAVRRVGATKPIEVDVRLIAASNRSLSELVAAREFREDLFHRLDLFRLRLPPLRERGEDILNLADTLLERLCRRHRSAKRQLSAAARRRLLAYSWPGNVRELAHELERALVFEIGETLELQQLAQETRAESVVKLDVNDWFNERFVIPAEGFSIEAAMMRLIRHAMRQTGENMSAAARILGVPRDYLRYRLERKQWPECSNEDVGQLQKERRV